MGEKEAEKEAGKEMLCPESVPNSCALDKGSNLNKAMNDLI